MLAKENRKLTYKEVEKNANKRGFESAIDWLLSSKMVLKCNNIEKIEKYFV